MVERYERQQIQGWLLKVPIAGLIQWFGIAEQGGVIVYSQTGN